MFHSLTWILLYYSVMEITIALSSISLCACLHNFSFFYPSNNLYISNIPLRQL